MDSCVKNVLSRTVNVRLPRECRVRNLGNRIDSAGMLLENYANFKRSGVPERVMCFDGENWVDLGGEVLEGVKLGFREGRAVMEGVVGGVRCLFDFMRMVLMEFGSGRRRSVAWIDVDGKCFFPKSFVFDEGSEEDDFEEVTIGIEVRLGDETKLGKRKRGEMVELDQVGVREAREYSDESQLSDNRGGRRSTFVKQAFAEADVGVARWPNCRQMREEHSGYGVVKRLFLGRLSDVDPGVSVRSVSYFVRSDGTARARSLAFKRCVELTMAARGKANVIFAWYGTTADGVGRIMAHGFGVPSNIEESHGVGVYLRPISLPHLSAMELEPDENGEKHVILCRVLLGNVEKVEAGSNQCCPSSTYFDNGVDDLQNPKRYIVWGGNMNTHILPECVVTFKSSGHVSGAMGGSKAVTAPNSSVLFSTLMSKLPNYLPPVKVNKITKLYSAYKAGRVTKDDLIKGTQAIASDKILRLALSACHEMSNKKIKVTQNFVSTENI